MDFIAVGLLTTLLVGVSLAVLRSVRTGRRRFLLLIPLLLAVVAWRWAAYRQAWWELGLSIAAAAVILLGWWRAYGRRLPPPSDDNIRVWTPDDPF